MEYYYVIIDTDFKHGNMADYIFGVNKEFINEFRSVCKSLEEKYDCYFNISQASYYEPYWSFDDIHETVYWLDDLLLMPSEPLNLP
jgi:hypothetical protein